MTNKRVYISGAITGVENLNQEAFKNAAWNWRWAGYYVQNPHEIAGADTTKPWSYFMLVDLIVLMMAADCIAVIDGWQHSKGARIELLIARVFGLEIYDAETFQRIKPRMSICIEGANELELNED